MKLAVVIPATHGREENLHLAIASLRDQRADLPIIVVDDGGELEYPPPTGVEILHTPKHEPGFEQPRNIGARYAKRHEATHIWFVDSDIVLVPHAYAHITAALAEQPKRVLVCPYEWLGPGQRPSEPIAEDHEFWRQAIEERSDPRWEMFHASPSEREYLNDLSAGLACFSGNLVWPLDEFTRVGGFWSELHHGRCEDGELGVRAVAMEVPISLVAGARGFHLWHPINHGLALERNARDVPMLNARHPWIEGADVFMSDRDGAAFDVRCPCGEVVPTAGWWAHAADCNATTMELTAR